MDTADLNDAYTVRSLDDLAEIYAMGDQKCQALVIWFG